MASPSYKRPLIGLLLITVGTIFLLDNLGYDIELPYYLFSWPAIFVAIGVINLISGNKRAALIFFGLAGIFYLQYFDIIRLRDIWPVIIILIGLAFLLRRRSDNLNRTAESSEDTIEEVAIFGGTEKKFTSENFSGGKITCIFGGSEIDLRECKSQEGAFLEVFCLFGGVDLKVPENWKVNMDNTAIFGGFSDERKTSNSVQDVGVKVKGFVMFGGGEIRN
ncbi:MAG: DUF5668 domain-containing protein [Bacteroidota bacterium]